MAGGSDELAGTGHEGFPVLDMLLHLIFIVSIFAQVEKICMKLRFKIVFSSKIVGFGNMYDQDFF